MDVASKCNIFGIMKQIILLDSIKIRIVCGQITGITTSVII